MIYFDNAATTYPKPIQVVNALTESMTRYGVNPGRSAYEAALSTAQQVYSARLEAAEFFNLHDEQGVIFTQNCTAALNTVIKGLAGKGSHFVISDLEHNAVVRPLETLRMRGICEYSIAKFSEDDTRTVENFRSQMRDNTVAVICTAASNVFGVRLPFAKIARLAHEYGAVFVLDAAQTAGIIQTDMQSDSIDYMCVAAHKGLYAPMAIGMLLVNCDRPLETLVEGGTGTQSALPLQPSQLPERFEAGTLSVPLIIAMKQGIRFVKSKGIAGLYNHEMNLIKTVHSELSSMKNVVLYTDPFSREDGFVPLISFNVQGIPSETVAQKLSQKNIAVRAGFHCAYSAHKAFSTDVGGTVRIAPSAFNTKNDVNLLLNSIFQIAKAQFI